MNYKLFLFLDILFEPNYFCVLKGEEFDWQESPASPKLAVWNHASGEGDWKMPLIQVLLFRI